MPDGADTTRDAVAAAFKEVTEREPAAPEPAAEPATKPSSAAPAPEAEAVEPSKVEPKRDGKGRFIVPPKQKPAASEAPATSAPAGQGGAVSVPAPVQGAAPPAVQKALEALKPPQSLKAMAREKWGAWPREAQEELVRLHHESSRTLAESVATRKAWDTHQQAIAPYEGMIRAEGMEPAQAVGLLLQREQALRTAPLAVKAKLIAHGYKTFLGNSQEAVDAFVAALNEQPQQGGAQQQASIDPRQIIAQAKQEFFKEFQQHRDQQISSSVQSDMEQFDGAHEFVADRDMNGEFTKDAMKLRRTMSILLSEAAEDGEAKTLQQVYDEALMLHPVFSAIVKQREAAKAATAKAATVQAGRAASSSIRSEPAGPSNGKAKDVREAVAEAYYAQKNAR